MDLDDPKVFPVKEQASDASQINLNIESTPKKGRYEFMKFPQDDNSTLPKNVHQSVEKAIKLQFSTSKKKSKKLWTKQEDDLLRHLVQSNGPKQWATISSYFIERCGKQCRQRWHNHLREGIKKGQWSLQEEWFLFLGVHTYGKKWSIISKLLKGRTENTLKNHWNCKMKPKKSKLQHKMRNLIRKQISQSDNLNLNLIELKLLEQIRRKNNFECLKSSSTYADFNQIYLKIYKESWENYIKTKQQIQKWSIAEKSKQKNDENMRFDLACDISFGKKKQEIDYKGYFKDRNFEFQKNEQNLDIREEKYDVKDEKPFKKSFRQIYEQNQSQSHSLEVISLSQQIKEDQFSDYVGNFSSPNGKIQDSKRRFNYQIDSFLSPKNPEAFEKMFLGRSSEKK